MNKTLRIVLTLVVLILLSVFIFSAYKLYDIYHGYKVAENTYKDMSNQFVSGTENNEDINGTQSSVNSEQISNVPKEKSPIDVDFAQLQSTCPDVVGWIYCPDTVINYPVVQSSDNSKYLHTLMNGSYNANGTIFIDYRNARDFSNRSTLVYGHHMNDGSMFASIVNYAKPEYLEAHPVLYLNTPTQNYRVEVFSGFITASNSSAYSISFNNDDDFESFAAKMQAFSDVSTDVQVHGNDRIIVLSTCTYEYDDARYVVFGKLVPIG